VYKLFAKVVSLDFKNFTFSFSMFVGKVIRSLLMELCMGKVPLFTMMISLMEHCFLVSRSMIPYEFSFPFLLDLHTPHKFGHTLF
jgi:hypothetical protein